MSRSQRKRVCQFVCVGACGFACIWLVSNWCLVRFALYHSQNRWLQPDDYDVQVLTTEDYRHMSDPNQRTVALSSGAVVRKGKNWESGVLLNYKPVNEGSLYTLVTLKGTAPFVPQLEGVIIPVFLVSSIGFFVGVRSLRNG